MITYIIATISSILFGYLAQHIKQESTKEKSIAFFFRVLAILPLFLVMALRYDVGTDFFGYRERFLWRIDGYDLSDKYEFGFIKIIDFILLNTQDPQWLFVICAAIFCSFTFVAIYQQSEDYFYSILILVIGNHYFGAMNLLRNYLALSIALFAFKYVKSRNIVKYLICIALASTIHKAVIVFVPLYFLYNNMKISRKSIILIIIATVVALPVIGKVIRHLVENYSNYYEYYTRAKSEIIPQYTDIIVNTILMIIALHYYKDEAKEDKEYKLYVLIELMCLMISISSFVIPMIRRVILIPIFLQIIYIPYLTKYEKNKKRKLLINLAIVVLLSTVTLKRVAVSGMHEVLPYQTIFSQKS